MPAKHDVPPVTLRLGTSLATAVMLAACAPFASGDEVDAGTNEVRDAGADDAGIWVDTSGCTTDAGGVPSVCVASDAGCSDLFAAAAGRAEAAMAAENVGCGADGDCAWMVASVQCQDPRFELVTCPRPMVREQACAAVAAVANVGTDVCASCRTGDCFAPGLCLPVSESRLRCIEGTCVEQ